MGGWALGALVAVGLAGPAADAADLRLSTLSGAPVPAAGQAGPTILAFWRADCAPCLIELNEAAAYAQAARPGRMLFVGLQQPQVLREAALKAGASLDLIVSADGAASEILTRFGGAPPRLPLAVALDASGRVCARRHGLLGIERVMAWAQTCGRSHAGG